MIVAIQPENFHDSPAGLWSLNLGLWTRDFGLSSCPPSRKKLIYFFKGVPLMAICGLLTFIAFKKTVGRTKRSESGNYFLPDSNFFI